MKNGCKVVKIVDDEIEILSVTDSFAMQEEAAEE